MTDEQIESEARLYSLDLANGLDWCFDNFSLMAFVRSILSTENPSTADADLSAAPAQSSDQIVSMPESTACFAPDCYQWDGTDSCTCRKSAVVLDDERAAFEASFKAWVGQSISFEKVTDEEGDERYVDEWLQGAWRGWQARATSPQSPSTEAVEEQIEQRLVVAIRQWAAKQKPLDAASAKVLYDNLWDMYVDDAAAQTAGEPKC